MEKKKHNERGAGRKKMYDDAVRFGGGMMPSSIYQLVKNGVNGLKGMPLVNAALEFYRQHHIN